MLCVFITTTVRWGACFYKQIGEVEGGWESTCGLGFSPGGGRGDIASECWLRKVFVDDCFSWILDFGFWILFFGFCFLVRAVDATVVCWI